MTTSLAPCRLEGHHEERQNWRLEDSEEQLDVNARIHDDTWNHSGALVCAPIEGP